MALKVLPVRSDIASYNFIITLDDIVYRLEFKFNSRMNLWLMDIIDSNETPIIVGRPIFSNINPLRIFVNEGLPPGTFVPLNLNENFVDAGEDDFGRFVKLFYNEAT